MSTDGALSGIDPAGERYRWPKDGSWHSYGTAIG